MLKGTDSIQMDDGEIMTVQDALDKGLLEIHQAENWEGRGKPAYFADYPGTARGFRVTASLYRSRTTRRSCAVGALGF